MRRILNLIQLKSKNFSKIELILFFLIGCAISLNENVDPHFLYVHYLVSRFWGLLIFVAVIFLGFFFPKKIWVCPIGIFIGSLFFNLLWLFVLQENNFEFQSMLQESFKILIWSFIFFVFGIASQYFLKMMDRSSRYVFLSYTLFVTLFMSLAPNENNFNSNVENWILITYCLLYFFLGFIFPKYFLMWVLGTFIGTFFFAIGTLATIEPGNDYAGNGLVLFAPFFTGSFVLVLSGLGLLSREIASKINGFIHRKKI